MHSTSTAPNSQHPRIPFGKFAGQRIDVIPGWYLVWLVEQPWLREKHPRLADAVERLLDGDSDDAPTTALSSQLIKAWHRRLVLRWHPDRPGGSHDGMIAVNYAHDLLLQMLEQSA